MGGTIKQIQYFPPIDPDIHPEVHKHLQLIYDRLQNHFTAIDTLNQKINDQAAEIAKLQGGK